ncbi:MAG TPA: hypothetical protein VFV38_40150 [Ktedonobacteraceae bacterium]|nr:hypothetical protein [Ktedonobacteraceae bacterium]
MTRYMISIQHTKQQLIELKIQYDIYSEQIERLTYTKAIETDTLKIFQLEKQIEYKSKQREETYRKMEILEKIDASTKLYRALLKLNYIEQTKVFKQLTDKSHIGAFVIHGDQDHGQRWLLNRLVNQILLTPGESSISIAFYPQRSWNFHAVLREIGRQIGRNYPASVAEIVEVLYNAWQQRTIVLIFRRVGTIHQELLQDLLEKFWCELAKKAASQPVVDSSFKLLLFLVDDDGVIDTWPFKCVEQVDTPLEPFLPVKFPRLTRIHSAELKNWIDHEWDELPVRVRSTPVEDILHQSGEGTPQLVLEHLCSLCDCDWSEMENQWIKH